jgi:hypothetical protein
MLMKESLSTFGQALLAQMVKAPPRDHPRPRHFFYCHAAAFGLTCVRWESHAAGGQFPFPRRAG